MTTYKELFASEPELARIMEACAIENDARCNKDTRGHVWALDEFGHVKVDGASTDFHNLIKCSKCGYVYCIACHNVPPKACTS